MKILLGTHQLEIHAGSELFTSELAAAFKARGHDVAVFTFFKGEIADLLTAQGIPVLGPKEVSALSAFEPDVVQTSHLPCAYLLRSLIPNAVRVHAMLGVMPHLEAPPADASAFHLGLTVSEEVLEKISLTPFGRSVETVLFRNWYNDGFIAKSHAPKSARPLRVVVVSNHIAPALVEALTRLESDGDVSVTYLGAERVSALIDGPLLVQHDLVVSIGRTAILAAACGVPCIMADIYGSDGLLTADKLNLVRAVNFSGRLARSEITAEHLSREINAVVSYDREALRRRVLTEYSLRSRVDWLLARYASLLASKSSKDATDGGAHAASVPVASEGFVYAEMAIRLKHTREELDKARSQIAKQKSRGWLRTIFGSSSV